MIDRLSEYWQLVDVTLSSHFRLTVDPRTLKPRIRVRSPLQEPVELPTYRRHHTTYNLPKYRRQVVLTINAHDIAFAKEDTRREAGRNSFAPTKILSRYATVEEDSTYG